MRPRWWTPLLAALLLVLGCALGAEAQTPRTAFDAIYPPQQIPLAFDHAVHVGKAKASCNDCHASVKTSVRVQDRNLPAEKVCFDCHDVLEEPIAEADPPAECKTCHPGYVPVMPEGIPKDETSKATPHPPPVEMPPAALKFGHKLHLERGIECDACHRGIAQAGLGTREHLPWMDQCTGCHDGRSAPDRCDTCHLSKPDGRLVTNLPGGKLLPRGKFRDDDHTGDIVRNHGAAARADAAYCANCHMESECATCHLSGPKPLSIHAADYILTHAPEARRNDPSCESCHRQQTFCRDCHVRSGVSDTVGSLYFSAAGNATGRFHPEGFVAPLGAVPTAAHHKFEARKNLRQCVGCHQESTCVQCHGVQASPAIRANPHPPGFRSQCDRALRQNDRGCVKCHESRAALEIMCGR